MLPVIAIYLLLCLVVAWIARKTVVGSCGYFIIAVVTTPLLAAFFLLVTRPSTGKKIKN